MLFGARTTLNRGSLLRHHYSKSFNFCNTMGGFFSDSTVKNISTAEFSAILRDPVKRAQFQIVDVREEAELKMARIKDDDIVVLPLSKNSMWATSIGSGRKLDPSKPTICFCHHGVRSVRAAHSLASNFSFNDVYSLQGGIDAYARDVDNSVGSY